MGDRPFGPFPVSGGARDDSILSLPKVSSGPASGTAAALARRSAGAASVPVDATSRALRAAASRILDAEGIGALSLRRVATEAGVTTMGIYSRFGGKDGLLDALCLEASSASTPPAVPFRRRATR